MKFENEILLEDEFLADNPAIYDFMRDNAKLIDEYFIDFQSLFNDYGVLYQDEKLSPNVFACVFAGPSVLNSQGFKEYTDMRDIISLSYRLYSYFDEKTRNAKLNDLYDNILKVMQYFSSSETIYHSVLQAIHNYTNNSNAHLNFPIHDDAILTLLGNLNDGGKKQNFSADVFCDLVRLTSVGKLINHDIGKEIRTEIMLSELKIGLRSDKQYGIPVDNIMEIFANKNSLPIIRKYFDVNELLINLYSSIYQIGDMNHYLSVQLRNISDNNVDTVGKDLLPEDIEIVLKEHYINMQRIFDNLISCAEDEDYCQVLLSINDYTLSYILAHSPPKDLNFFVKSSYDKVVELYHKLVDDKGNNRNNLNPIYKKNIRSILTLLPNLDMPEWIFDHLCWIDNITRERIIRAIRIGFLRYTLVVLGKIESELVNNLSRLSVEEVPYLQMNFIQRVHYLLSDDIVEEIEVDYDPHYSPNPDENSRDENEESKVVESPEHFIANSKAYRDSNFSLTLRKTNELITYMAIAGLQDRKME